MKNCSSQFPKRPWMENRDSFEREENVVKDYYIDIAIVIKIMYPFAIQIQQWPHNLLHFQFPGIKRLPTLGNKNTLQLHSERIIWIPYHISSLHMQRKKSKVHDINHWSMDIYARNWNQWSYSWNTFRSVQSGFNCGHSLLFLSSGNLMQVKQLLPQAPPLVELYKLLDKSLK